MCKEVTLAAMRDTKTARGSFLIYSVSCDITKDSGLQRVATGLRIKKFRKELLLIKVNQKVLDG